MAGVDEFVVASFIRLDLGTLSLPSLLLSRISFMHWFLLRFSLRRFLALHVLLWATLGVINPTATQAQSGNGTPYSGTALAIPGTIQAEHFNLGGEAVAYHDTGASNLTAAFRTTEGVDIDNCNDVGGGHYVSWIDSSEWLKYAVNVQTAGTYSLTARVATVYAGKSFHVEVNGVNVSGAIAVPNTGGWETWWDVAVPNITLSAGAQTMRIVMDRDRKSVV